MFTTRKRKTLEPCLRCYMHKDLCVCSAIPRLTLATRVSLIVHFRELRRTTNTGRLAIEALDNSEMIVRGADRTPLDLSRLVTSEYQTVLFYPSEDSIDLSELQRDGRPVHLIVPDGNWRQASKVGTRHPELAGLPRVKISAINTAIYHLRAEHSPEGMSTLEAIARAIAVVEGDEAAEPLLALYQAKLTATLIARGVLARRI